MLIRILTKPIVVDCFTAEQSSYDLFKLTPAMDRVPDWWKKTPATYPDSGVMPGRTLKSCDGFVNLYKRGFILPMWSDLAIEIQNDGYRWQYSDMKSNADVHPTQQWATYVSDTVYGHIKLQSHWRMKSSTSLDWLYTSPSWSYKPNSGWTVVSGVVNYKYSREVNVNLFLDKTKNRTIILNVDTPLVHMIPLTDRRVDLRHHLVTHEEYSRLAMPTIAFSKYTNVMDKIMNRQKSKCPFGFGG